MQGKSTILIVNNLLSWCAPCKKLTPILETLAAEANGKFKLVKLNIDDLPQIATALQVKSIPAVFLIYKGNMIDSFVGIPKEQVFKEFINTAMMIETIAHDEEVIVTAITAIEEYITNGELELANKMLTEGYSYEIWREKFGP